MREARWPSRSTQGKPCGGSEAPWGQEAAEAVVDVIAEAQEELVTTSQLRLELALLEKRILVLVLLQTGIIIGAVAAIEVLVSS